MPVYQKPDFPIANSIANIIAQHILEVINHLKTTDKINQNTSNDAIASPSDPNHENYEVFTLLLIGQSPLIQYLNDYIFEKVESIVIKTTTLEEFTQMSFETQYELGCFIDSNICEVNPAKSEHFKKTMDSKTLSHEFINRDKVNEVATRLRDLFAQQSLIFLNVSKDTLSLNNLGYSLNTLQIQDNHENNMNENNPNIESIYCWQFNLYDYKKRPDWLNSKYWANPENFDKYRW